MRLRLTDRLNRRSARSIDSLSLSLMPTANANTSYGNSCFFEQRIIGNIDVTFNNRTLLLATKNPGKVREIRLALEGLPIEVVSALDVEGLPDVEETESTLDGNARLKAEEIFRRAGLPTLSDDTGLEVVALGGAPGVKSARYAGEPSDPAANRALLLKELQGKARREARFRTVMAFRDETGIYAFDGICDGVIESAGRGTGGFGYDELFRPDGFDRTFAELDPATKNAISHRGKALRRFVAFISDHWKTRATE